MTLVCLLFLISLHSCLSSLSFQSPHTHSPRLPFSPFSPSVLHSFSSLSVCLGVLSLIRAFGPSWQPTPLNSSMSATPSLPFHCHLNALLRHRPTPQRFSLPTLTSLLLLPLLLLFFFCIFLGLCLLSLQSVQVNVKWSCNSIVHMAVNRK